MTTAFDFCASAKKVLEIETQALVNLSQYFNADFARAANHILGIDGKVIIMGMGKSGHIGRKIAATLASTGTPSFFVHPGEASHGDLGMIEKKDIVIAISNSGEAHEILSLIPAISRQGIPLIAMTGNPDSSLAKAALYHLQITVKQEACPLGLAPTSSTTATLVMGDALAISLLEARGFTREDFALSHPGGALGRKLLLKISDIMRSGQALPVVREEDLVKDALYEISNKGLGMTAIVDNDQNLTGIFTDGDLRRLFDRRVDVHDTRIKEVMTRNPTTAKPSQLAAEGLRIMEDKKINALLILDNDTLVGALNMHDLLQAGVI